MSEDIPQEQLDEWVKQVEESKKRKYSNKENSIAILKSKNVPFDELSPWHYRIGEYDFWPSTGKFINRYTKKQGRGVFNLLKIINV